jgi:hypothetical protein
MDHRVRSSSGTEPDSVQGKGLHALCNQGDAMIRAIESELNFG